MGIKTTKADPYSATLHIAQRLQLLEDKRGEFASVIDEMLIVCEQLIRCQDLTADDKIAVAGIVHDVKRDRALLFDMNMFDHVENWRDVVASFRPDPFYRSDKDAE